MSRIWIVGYREWANDLYQLVREQLRGHGIDVLWCKDLADVGDYIGITYLVGWSEIVPAEFYADRTVLVLHPSPLPYYRGGSPIQHQIMDGMETSAVSLFRLDVDHPEVDSGPLAWQQGYSLAGELSDVLGRIARIGARGVIETTLAFARDDLACWEQPQGGSWLKRRTPEKSEITTEELDTLSARQLHDKVRALQDPYPNAFIRTADGGKLYIHRTSYEDQPLDLWKTS